MQIGIYHTIKDAKKWEQTKKSVMNKIESNTLPKGMKALVLVPDTKHQVTFCLWEAPSIKSLKEFIDKESGPAVRNEYFEVDTKSLIGLPQLATAK